MAFSHKDFVFSHTITRASAGHQPLIFKLDLSDLLVHFSGHSSIFTIDTMTLTAYKRVTAERIPVKFAVLNENKTRVLTNDSHKLSSRWQVDLQPRLHVNMAGADTQPFARAFSVYEETNRRATLNVLAFMMSHSLWVADNSRGAVDVLVQSPLSTFNVKCEICSRVGVVSITRGPSGLPTFTFPQCVDAYPCVPSHQPGLDSNYQALCRTTELVRCACCDNLDVLTQLTRKMGMERLFQDVDCSSFPPKHVYTGDVVIPYSLMKQLSRLYQTMSEYADIFAIVDERTPHVKVLIESPSENIGEITGSVGITVIYGSSVSNIYNKLTQEPVHEEQLDEFEITQLTNDVLIRRVPLNFRFASHMNLKEWYDFYYKTEVP